MEVIHVLADGTEKKSIEGYRIKPEQNPEIYEILKKIGGKQK